MSIPLRYFNPMIEIYTDAPDHWFFQPHPDAETVHFVSREDALEEAAKHGPATVIHVRTASMEIKFG